MRPFPIAHYYVAESPHPLGEPVFAGGEAPAQIARALRKRATLRAITGSLSFSATTPALGYNIEASNLWAFFQAKTIRQTTLRTAAEQLDASAATEAAKKQSAKWRDTAQRYQDEPDTGEGRTQLAARAKVAEKKRDLALAAYHHFEMSSASVQIAIVLASASIITTIPALFWTAGALGVVGVAFCVIGFWFPTAVRLF